MDRFTRGIALASARHPWRTITSWVLVLGAVFVLAASGGGTFADDFSSPGSQSDRATRLLTENFPEAAKGSALVVLQAQNGTTLADQREQVEAVLSDVATFDHVASVADPFRPTALHAQLLELRARQLGADVPERHGRVVLHPRTS